jgi:hypothetical protein
MARSADEIQNDIVLTREDLTRRLDALQYQARRPAWMGLGLAGAGLLAGLLLTQAPFGRVLTVGARMIQAGLGIAAAVVTLRRALAAGAERADPGVHAARQLRNRLRQAA